MGTGLTMRRGRRDREREGPRRKIKEGKNERMRERKNRKEENNELCDQRTKESKIREIRRHRERGKE